MNVTDLFLSVVGEGGGTPTTEEINKETVSRPDVYAVLLFTSEGGIVEYREVEEGFTVQSTEEENEQGL